MITRRTCLATLLTVVTAVGAHEVVAQTADDEGVVRGTVIGRFDTETRPLAFAFVEVTAGNRRFTATADSLGRYAVEGLPAGEILVRASHTGHQSITLRVMLPPEAPVTLDLELAARPLQLPRLQVEGDEVRSEPTTGVRDRPIVSPELEVETLDLGPGVAHAGLVEAVGAIPGNDPANATDVLFMRGTTTDLKLVLLNGIPVYTPFHVGGLLKSFEPSVLERAELHVGGAPARYDGGLSHILDLETRRAQRDRTRLSGSADLLSASFGIEAPLTDRVGIIASARSLHDAGTATLGGERPYGYSDVLASLDADLGSERSIVGTGFWNSESVRLDFNQLPDDALWENRAASLAYRDRLGGARLDITLGASGYAAELPLHATPESAGPLRDPMQASAEVNRGKAVAEVSWLDRAMPIRIGASAERIDAHYAAAGNLTTAESRSVTTAGGLFVDVTRTLAQGVTVRGGLRADAFSRDEVRLAPRAAVHWEIDNETLLTLAAGRYHQPTRSPDFEVERTLVDVVDAGATSVDLLPVAKADHVVLSLDQLLAGSVRLGLEGFWKGYEGIASAGNEAIRSSGIDVRVLSTGDAGTVWLGYGLSWYWSTVDLSGYASDFAGRHLLSAGLSGSLPGPFRGEARLSYGAGLPYTAIPFSGDEALSPGSLVGPGPGPSTSSTQQRSASEALARGLDEEFLRIDIEVHAELRPAWGARQWTVRPYLRVLNALDRRDSLFYTFQPWRPDSVRALAERPLLPVVGVSFSF